MNDETSFDIGAVTDDDRTTFDVVLAYKEDGTPKAAISILGKNSQEYRNAELAWNRRQLKKGSARGRRSTTIDDSVADELSSAVRGREIFMLTAVTTGWYGMSSGGVPYEYSKQEAERLYTCNNYTRERVASALEVQANFLPG